MKRFLIIFAVLLAILAGGWTVVWHVGKGRVEARIDEEAAAIARQGWTVTWATREITGFPFGYGARVTGLALVSARGGVLVRVPGVEAGSDPDDPARILARIAGPVSVDLPLGESLRYENQLLPKVLKVAITGDDMVLRLEGVDMGLLALGLTAARVELSVDQPDFAVKLGLVATGLDAGVAPDRDGRKLSFRARRTETEMVDRSVAHRPSFGTGYDAVAMTATVAAPSVEGFMAGLATRQEGLVAGTFESTGFEIVAAQFDATGQGEMRLTWTGGRQTGTFGIDAGQFAYAGEDQDVAASLELPPAGGRPATVLAARADAYERALSLPVWTGQAQPNPAALRIVLTGIEADETVWRAYDPAGVLDHGAGAFTLDLDGTLRFRPAAGGALPIEVSNLSVNALKLAALGAAADVAGDIEILQPIALPLGELAVELTGASRLIDGLLAAGLLGETAHETAARILHVYARAADDADRHETEIRFDPAGVLINGLPLEQRTPPPAPTPDPVPEPAE